MTLAEAYGIAAPPVSVVASDVDTDVLEIARRGVYPLARVKDLSRSYLRSYFRRGTGSNAGLARVSPPIAALVEFQQINLLDHRWSLHGMFDAIFCRNVLIYFDRLGQDRVLDRLTRHLKEGGLLMLGHSESIRNPRAHFTPLGRTAYRKSTATGSAP
jgi:chemotaxis protein methyltransferase CheR